jgi:uncharacterized protein (DUF885 family)
MRGVHAQIPTFLINVHKVDNEKDARAYIARLNAIPKLFDQVIVNLRTCEGKGVVAPKFVFRWCSRLVIRSLVEHHLTIPERTIRCWLISKRKLAD